MIEIKRANKEDIKLMSQIHARSWKQAYKGLLPQSYLDQLKEDRWVEIMTKSFENKNFAAWIALFDGEAAACICAAKSMYRRYTNDWELISLYALDKFWGKGIGKKLLDTALEHGKTKGFKRAGLWVLDKNERAIKFYENYGMKKINDKIFSEIGGMKTTEIRFVIDL
ncbi:MAG: GNAT family N-acetyltransferase [Tissierellia bacterium]|nr:GNAT family N-acetyltransferase [Tissierellia bacterium]